MVYKSLEKTIEEKYPGTGKPKKFTTECKGTASLPKVGIRDNSLLSLEYIEWKQGGEQLLI